MAKNTERPIFTLKLRFQRYIASHSRSVNNCGGHDRNVWRRLTFGLSIWCGVRSCVTARSLKCTCCCVAQALDLFNVDMDIWWFCWDTETCQDLETDFLWSICRAMYGDWSRLKDPYVCSLASHKTVARPAMLSAFSWHFWTLHPQRGNVKETEGEKKTRGGI